MLSGDYSGYSSAIDSNYSAGNQPGVTIEYLTIEKFTAARQCRGHQSGFQHQLDPRVQHGHPERARRRVIAGSDNTIKDNCLTLNGQYGFQSSVVGPWGHDSLTSGPYDVTVEDNEISYNDTCDYEGLLNNSAIGWTNYNPVPADTGIRTAAR